jgi:hypothetical protein
VLRPPLEDEKSTQRKLFHEHYELRSEYIKEKATDSKEKGNDKEAKELQQLHRRETTKRDYAELRTIFHPNRSNGISHLEIHDPIDGTVTKITDPKQIEDTIIERNVSHFGQAQGTPFTTGKIQEILGYE